MTVRIAINGLGRIGRCIMRAIHELPHKDIHLVAVNGPAAAKIHAHLLKYDSVHGAFPGEVKVTDNAIYMGKGPIRLLTEREPAKLPWKELEVDIVLECTGKFTKYDDAYQHVKSGAKRVMISSPSPNAEAMIVYGVNNAALRKHHKVISIGSCTTNCLAPLVKVLHDRVGIESGYMTTIHSYTNDQNVLDGSHKDLRRARACHLSMIPTTTGAAESIAKVIPELAGKLSGTAMRVPTPNVSFVDLTFIASRGTSVEEVNNAMIRASYEEMSGVVTINREELVSIDFNHNPFSCIFDVTQTEVVGGKLVRVGAWYDNEWAFSLRMLDVAVLWASR